MSSMATEEIIRIRSTYGSRGTSAVLGSNITHGHVERACSSPAVVFKLSGTSPALVHKCISDTKS